MVSKIIFLEYLFNKITVSIFLGLLIGIIYGLFFVFLQKRALSLKLNNPDLNTDLTPDLTGPNLNNQNLTPDLTKPELNNQDLTPDDLTVPKLNNQDLTNITQKDQNLTKKTILLSIISALRFLLLILLFFYLLRLNSINFIILLLAFFLAFWFTVYKQGASNYGIK